MPSSAPEEIERLLAAARRDEEGARERLFEVVYEELRRRAGFVMTGERMDHTLQPTALVHEAFIKVQSRESVDWESSQHFLNTVVRAMRFVLVDHARKRRRKKNRPPGPRQTLDEFTAAMEESTGDLVALNDALEDLESRDPGMARIVELRFFGGFQLNELPEILSVPLRRVEREWQLARAWLAKSIHVP